MARKTKKAAQRDGLRLGLYTLAETARELGVSRDTVRKAIREGELEVIKLGPRIHRVAEDDLRAFLERRRVRAA